MGNPWKVLLRSLESTALRAFYNVTRSRRALARYAVSVVALAIEKMNLQPSRSNPFSGVYATGHIVHGAAEPQMQPGNSIVSMFASYADKFASFAPGISGPYNQIKGATRLGSDAWNHFTDEEKSNGLENGAYDFGSIGYKPLAAGSVINTLRDRYHGHISNERLEFNLGTSAAGLVFPYASAVAGFADVMDYAHDQGWLQWLNEKMKTN